jgi:hypothetical protein
VLVPQLAAEGTLGALLAKDAVLLGGQLGTPASVLVEGIVGLVSVMTELYLRTVAER